MNLLTLSIAPVAILLLWVYHKDHYEKEPMGLIFFIVLFGAIACIPAALIEVFIEPLLIQENSGLLQLLIYTTVGIGLVEEGCKFIMLRQVTWRSRYFSQRFDGIVYAVSASLGFALLENILYVVSGGVTVGLLRALTAVPMHAVFGVIMGLHYGQARFDGATNPVWTFNQANRLLSEHVMVPGSPKKVQAGLRKAILIPTLLHGLYDFFAMAAAESALFLIPLVLLLAASIVYAAKLVLHASRLP